MPYLSPDPQFAPVALRISNRSLCLHTQLVSPVGFLVDPRSPWRQVSWSGLNRFAEKEISHFVSSFWKTFKKAKNGRSSILSVLFGKHLKKQNMDDRPFWQFFLENILKSRAGHSETTGAPPVNFPEIGQDHAEQKSWQQGAASWLFTDLFRTPGILYCMRAPSSYLSPVRS